MLFYILIIAEEKEDKICGFYKADIQTNNAAWRPLCF